MKDGGNMSYNTNGNENGIVLTEREQETLRNTDKKIYDTYHHPKNKEILPIVIFFSVIAIIFRGAMLYETIIWGIYYLYCSSNNEKWSNHPNNVKERQYLLSFRQKLLNGELRKYHIEN